VTVQVPALALLTSRTMPRLPMSVPEIVSDAVTAARFVAVPPEATAVTVSSAIRRTSQGETVPPDGGSYCGIRV
jgi:hypothetical protein